jgi:hypothetical protein
MAKAATEIVFDEFMPWPFFAPYGMVERKIVKPKKARKPRRSRAATKALFTSALFKPKVIPNKKKVTKARGKVTLGGDE